MKSRIDEMVQRKCLKRSEALLEGEKQHAGDRELGIELAVVLFGRTVDLLQFKKVMNFFSNEERMVIYSRLGPLNALNPLEPDGRWRLRLGGKPQGYIKDENAIAHMLVLLAVRGPGLFPWTIVPCIRSLIPSWFRILDRAGRRARGELAGRDFRAAGG